MSLIVPGLYLGDRADSEACKYDFVVNCTDDLPFKCPKTVYMRLPVRDNLEASQMTRLLALLPAAVAAIDAHLNAGNTVLVHCMMGMQRSAAVAAAYLMWKFQLTAAQAVEFVRKRRSVAFFWSVNFQPTLEAWALRLKK